MIIKKVKNGFRGDDSGCEEVFEAAHPAVATRTPGTPGPLSAFMKNRFLFIGFAKRAGLCTPNPTPWGSLGLYRGTIEAL